MKKVLFLLSICLSLIACEQYDVRTEAANIIYANCINNGENPRWCSCLRADLRTGFSKETASLLVKGYQHMYINLEVNAARIRCGCRMQPASFAAYGLDCSGVKKLNY